MTAWTNALKCDEIRGITQKK